MFGLGGVGDGLAAIVILACLGLVFIVGALIAVFLRIVGVKTGRAVLWGFGVPLAGFVAMGLLAVTTARERLEVAEASIGIPYPPGGPDDAGE